MGLLIRIRTSTKIIINTYKTWLYDIRIWIFLAGELKSCKLSNLRSEKPFSLLWLEVGQCLLITNVPKFQNLKFNHTGAIYLIVNIGQNIFKMLNPFSIV